MEKIKKQIMTQWLEQAKEEVAEYQAELDRLLDQLESQGIHVDQGEYQVVIPQGLPDETLGQLVRLTLLTSKQSVAVVGFTDEGGQSRTAAGYKHFAEKYLRPN